ncbi:MAG: hypothetical protein E6J39_04365 [Chloroflexi bacterium]|nr:MAG: hypothetical protein E6J39_04365 [Chloroflexota bacterium]
MNIPDHPRQFSLAAANGITPRMVDTWYPFLIRLPRVLVPMHVDALIVRQGGGTWARTGMKTPPPDAQGKPLDSLMPKVFANLPGPRPPGAYLHWALPSALTAGVHQSDSPDDPGTTKFPSIPDRWLVVRVFPSKKDPSMRTVRGWVLQSADRNAPGLDHPAAHDLDAWKETGGQPDPALQPFTTIGYGNLSWAAYFDNVRNRLGFYDDLSDVPAGPIAYLVCGWYSDPALDPLGDPAIRSLADFNQRMKDLSWSLPDTDFHEALQSAQDHLKVTMDLGLASEWPTKLRPEADAPFNPRSPKQASPAVPVGPPYVSDGSWWPQATLCHGSVVAIGWPTVGWPGNDKGVLSGEEGGPPPASAVNVVVGNSIVEAMAVLVGKATKSTQDARILEAFQLNVLPELDEPDGRARLDAVLHSKTFGSKPGGNVDDRVWQPPSGPEPPPPDSAPPGPGVFQPPQSYRKAPPGNLPVGTGVAQPTHADVQSKPQFSPAVMQESQVLQGGLAAIINYVAPPGVEPYQPGKWVDTKRPLPRWYNPLDPVILVQGAQRSFKHGSDIRFNPDGTLPCRISGTPAKQYSPLHGDIVQPPLYPYYFLERGVDNGSVPTDCDDLLGEMVLYDPGCSAPIVQAGAQGQPLPAAQLTVQVQKVMVDQTAWWVTRDPRIDAGPVLSKVNYGGVLPSPVAVSPPIHPWNPLHLEWRVEFIPSPGGAKDWTPGEVDFNETVPKLPPAAGAKNVITLEGRTPVTAGASSTLASSVRLALAQVASAGGTGSLPPQLIEAMASHLGLQLMYDIDTYQVQNVPGSGTGADSSALEDIATALDSIDVLAGSLGGLHTKLRGGYPADGVSKPGPNDPAASPCVVVRAGFLHLLRLRVVDTFGQFIDLCGSSDAVPVSPAALLRSEPLDVTGRPELLALPPRFTSPTRIWLRYMDAEGGPDEARLATDVNPTAVSPVCGYIMPNHLDQALEVFGGDGANLGMIRPTDDGAVVWEIAPGTPSTLGQRPSSIIPNPFLGAIGDALLRWGVTDAGVPGEQDTALQALLRVIDSTLWSVDPFGHHGDEHLALLVGHPVSVMRAVLRVEVNEPIDVATANLEAVPVRLGSLAQWQDGVLGYFVNDDYTRLYCSDAAAAGLARPVGQNLGFLQQANLVPPYYGAFSADLPPGVSKGSTPVSHPYVDLSGTMYVHPNQDVRLTLLVEPLGQVHATTGLTPRKDIGMRREWVHDGLAKLAPTFRFGPVLIDPKSIRMPIAHEIPGSWSWDHRQDVNTWAEDPVTHAGQEAILSPDPLMGSEGWLRLSPPEEKPKP